MKYILSLLSCSSLFAMAQEKLENISVPSSPASSILGAQPSELLAPKSYKALETALYTNFVDENSSLIIPEDFALEFTPYWVKDRGMNLEEYLFPTLEQALFRNSSFSLASTQKYLLGDSSNSNAIAFGYRNSIQLNFRNQRTEARDIYKRLNGPLDSIQKVTTAIKSVTLEAYNKCEPKTKEKYSKEFNSLIKEHPSAKNPLFKRVVELYLDSLFILPELSKENFMPESIDLLDRISKYSDEYETINSMVEKLVGSKKGLSLEFAYANLLNFPNNQFDLSYIPTQSFWITPTFTFSNYQKSKPKSEYLNTKFMLVYRRQWYNQKFYDNFFNSTEQLTDNHDFGGAVKVEFKKLSFQFEFIGRFGRKRVAAGFDGNGNELFYEKKINDLQYIGSLNYLLTDQIILSYNLGSQFITIYNKENSLISMLTLNFGIGAPAKETLYELR